ncbi:MAG: calcium-transporting P-type ATPase, PMR1-type [Candidatus Odinarchaeum yellowstonii]|uniref:P-type Ca(2+) transporter n=1 Tax=Odinarchaeota yellowstonii (strain LCB_4) TaxID=1841599 RepID=A0AAF0ICM2_ODILC|nr:MAG: calcium-transporting P-type ATPase, PMR1-type [Candidatus Odinarchaeum yellowstonii]
MRTAMEKEWFTLEEEELYKELKTSPAGLSKLEAKNRLMDYGLNELRRIKRRSKLELFLEQFKNVLIVILIIAALISVFLGEILDAAVIGVIVVLNAVIGFIQEYKAEKAIEALKELAAPQATVIRDGKEIQIPAKEIVPGDIVLIDTGDRIPADIRLTSASNLKIDESSLTGESIPVKKKTEPLKNGFIPLAERSNMAFSGTIVTSGYGKGVVVATGMDTEIGHIATMISQEEEKETPLQKKLDILGKKLGQIIIVLCVIVFLTGFLRGIPFIEIFLASVGLAVAAIPEGLPAIVTMGLALGIQRMAKRNAIIRKLPAVETLGSANVICSDKTGTLTKNEMTVRRIRLASSSIEVTGEGYTPRGEFLQNGKKINPLLDEDLTQLIKIGALCNNSALSFDPQKNRWFVTGDPTSGALIVLAEKAGLRHADLVQQYRRIAEIPFESERKRIVTLHEDPNGGRIIFVSGAPDVLLELSDYYLDNGQINKLDNEKKTMFLKLNDEMARQALRVIGLAYKKLDTHTFSIEDPSFDRGLVFTGLVGMMDPPRAEVKDAIKLASKAGIKTIMITGDHPNTAAAIAKELGILKEGELVITGSQLDAMGLEELEKIVEKVKVYARVSPKHKLQIIKALKKKGSILAMTGDGVNDAPALKSSDIGVAMGIAGTDVAKEASDMILADDNFTTIVAAVEEGRMVYDNIKKVVRYLISTNFGEIITIFVGIIIGLPLPILALQILWINLVTDGLPALALGVEPAERDLMERRPRDPNENILSKETLLNALIYGSIMAAGALGLYIFELFSLDYWGFLATNPTPEQIDIFLLRPRTVVFTVLMLFQMVSVFTFRSEKTSIFKMKFFGNKYLVIAVAISIALHLLVVYVPVMQMPFKTTFLNPSDWLLIIVLNLSLLVYSEIRKSFIRRAKI